MPKAKTKTTAQAATLAALDAANAEAVRAHHHGTKAEQIRAANAQRLALEAHNALATALEALHRTRKALRALGNAANSILGRFQKLSECGTLDEDEGSDDAAEALGDALAEAEDVLHALRA